MSKSWTPTPHPALPVPPATLPPDQWLGAAQLREELIRKEREDPFRHGFVPDHWKRASAVLEHDREVLVMGGNRSGKSSWAAREVMRALVEKPRARAWCFQTTAPNSVEMQQPYIWHNMPLEWKTAKKTQVTNISYSQKNGFSENAFVLPNGSQCWFRNYAQDVSTIEGGELDIIWCDELVPLDWLTTMRYRLLDRNGKLIVSFTPVEGYSATVKDYLTGAETVEEADAELLPIYGDVEGKRTLTGHEKVPVIQRCVRRKASVLYFHTRNNPWAGWTRMREELEKAARPEILCRAYGVPTKAIAGRFPLFSDRVHVIPQSRIPTKGTRYQFVDPCSGRNWFQMWLLIDDSGRAFVYREWPGQDYIDGVGYAGAWAEPDGKKADGRAGPAQKSFGFGLERYKEEIERLEKGEQVFERWMDSRYGNAATVARESATTLIEECAEIGLNFVATPGTNIDEGIDLINDWLHYDTGKPVDALNQPRLYVSEECKNTIHALKEWTGADGKTGALKDPIDCLRYFCLSGVTNVEGEILSVRAGGSY
jgi:hypothetical protein